jgi:hypothetical protein
VWDPRTTWDAATSGDLESLVYIYEHCGDVATWENANLENEFEKFGLKVRDFIDRVRESWKCGLNRPGLRTKSAKRN